MILTFNSKEEAEKAFSEDNASADIDVVSDEDELALIDLDGVKYEIIDTVMLDDRTYIALLPYTDDDEFTENVEFTVLEIVDDPEDEENCTLRTVDDEELYERVGEAFLEKFGLEEDEEE